MCTHWSLGVSNRVQSEQLKITGNKIIETVRLAETRNKLTETVNAVIDSQRVRTSQRTKCSLTGTLITANTYCLLL